MARLQGSSTHPYLGALFALLVACIASLAPRPALAQGGYFGAAEEKVPKVLATFETRIEPEGARPGEHARLIITAKIATGWYTYSVMPQEDEFAPPPTELTVEPGQLELLGPVYETNPVRKVDNVFKIPLAFHPDAARFYQNLRVPEDHAAGPLELNSRIRYQVCNNRICTPPRTESLTAAMRVEAGPVREGYAYIQRTVDYKNADGEFVIDADTLEGALSGGLASFLLLAVGFGLLALLTPCVFPMIPVTVSFFTGAADRRPGGVMRLALLFAAGIVLTTTGTGLVLTFLLGATGVSQFATSPWVNLAVAGFFVAFALSLMGLFNLSLPSGMTQRLNRASYDFKGPLGVILMGVAFTATSFTCTMPFIGTLLVAATQGQVLWPLVGMLVFSSVFAFPFFLLALFPRFVVKLRGRSGNWLVQIKVVLGLLELMAALKFVSNADLIWQWGFFDRDLLLLLWAVLSGVIALLVLGLLPWPGVTVARRGAFRLAMGGAFVALTMYLALGLTGRDLDSYTESYLPPSLEGKAYAAVGTGSAVDFVTMDAVHGLPWHTTLPPALEQARATGKPVFIDFTGYTCVNCRWMEKKVFAARPVFETFQKDFVLAQLYTDGGDHAEENQNLQVERFRTLALPYYVILSPGNAVLAKHAGITPTPEDFLAFLDHGRKQLADAAASKKE